MYPRVLVDLKKIDHNAKRMMALCSEYGIEIMAVTKVFSGARPIAEALYKAGIRRLGDSRTENVAKYADLPVEKWLIRMPSASKAEETVRVCDVTLNSEINTLKALNEAALRLGKIHKVILMVDLGDLREGYFEESELAEAVNFVRSCPALELYGLGTNLTCFSFVQPDTEKLSRLHDLAEKYDAAAVISGGNSATIDLMLRGGIPTGVNTLRLGESVLFGKERTNYSYLPDTFRDAFVLEAEIIEVKEKPSMPIGTIGCNSYGERPVFTDHGIRKRVICAVGKQDIDPEIMTPMYENAKIIGASSDHLVVDVTDADGSFEPGGIMRFCLGYFSVMRVFTSSYVEKVYMN